MTFRIADPTLTESERRLLLRLVDLEWGRVDKTTPGDTRHEEELSYLRDLESIAEKLK
jgi:hypothetical protein